MEKRRCMTASRWIRGLVLDLILNRLFDSADAVIRQCQRKDAAILDDDNAIERIDVDVLGQQAVELRRSCQCLTMPSVLFPQSHQVMMLRYVISGSAMRELSAILHV